MRIKAGFRHSLTRLILAEKFALFQRLNEDDDAFVAPQTKENIMTESKGKIYALIILVAVVTAVVVTLLQSLILGHSSAAVTGGVVGGVTAAVAITTLRKGSS
jgi:hypothetical protein